MTGLITLTSLISIFIEYLSMNLIVCNKPNILSVETEPERHCRVTLPSGSQQTIYSNTSIQVKQHHGLSCLVYHSYTDIER